MEMTIAARSRATIDESNRPPLASEAFATKFEAPRVLGIERTMTWAAGGPIYGAHSDTGIAAPRTSWLLAEGATIGGFNTFYLLQNPTTTAADVKVQYLLSTANASSGSTRSRRCRAPTSGSTRTRPNWRRRRCRRRSRR